MLHVYGASLDFVINVPNRKYLIFKINIVVIYSDCVQDYNIDGLTQKRRKSIANTLQLHLFCIKPLIQTAKWSWVARNWNGTCFD